MITPVTLNTVEFNHRDAMAIQDIADVEDALVSTDLKVRHLYELWELRQPVPESVATDSGKSRSLNRQIPWLQNSLANPLQFMEKALKHEEFLLACDVARETLWQWKEDGPDHLIPLVKVRMSYASALTRLGYTHKARAELERYAGEQYDRKLGKQQKVDILLQLGEIMREESHQATTRAVRSRTADKARQFYSRALAIDPTRLDALALTACASFVAGEPGSPVRKSAHDKARETLALAKTRADSEAPNWKTTWARAAAHTVLGEIDEAAEQYGALQLLEDVTTELLADIRYKTRFLAEALGEPRDLFKSNFPPLQLIVFAGHVLDLPGRSVRFPYESVERVREMLRLELDKPQFRARVGMVSAAAGADLLFIEALRERKGATFHLVLPWARDEFRRNSVCKFEPAGMAPVWEPLFDKALADAATIREMGDADTPSSKETWQYAMEVTAGLALHTARVSRLDIQPLVLWDKQPGWKPGGTASFVGFWRQHLRQEPQIINLPAPERSDGLSTSDGAGRRSENSTMQQEVKSMLFADIEGYSKLSEKVIPAFVETFMQRVALLVATSKHAPRCMNTWGDAIYAVFDFARDAGSFAIQLIQMIQEGEKDWLKNELYWEEPGSDGGEPKKHLLNIRIGLHTGPVFKHFDPVIRQIGFTGAHVSRAARIEPVAKPGEVFASEEFVAMAALDAEMQRRQGGGPQADSLAFVCEYAGSMQLAKGYPGRYRVYRVLPKPVLAVEELAKAAHESYCIECAARGETPESNPSYRPWDELTEDLRKANRAQIEDIPEKLAVIGYELAPSGGLRPSKIVVTDAEVELLAIREHDRWMKERLSQGWKPGDKTNRPLKIHEDLVGWDKLSEPAKEKDRDVVRNLTILLERAGLRVRKPVDRDGDTLAR
jgi:class 3 adenylate cyclase/tetratricopeptide (TPR) repeat protein